MLYSGLVTGQPSTDQFDTAGACIIVYTMWDHAGKFVKMQGNHAPHTGKHHLDERSECISAIMGPENTPVALGRWGQRLLTCQQPHLALWA